MIIGIIIEASPLHKGHEYFIKEIKKRYNDCTLICVTSSSFTMRGEISLINKFNKTTYLLQIGIDAVFELPITKTLHSGTFFARNAINLLNKIGVDKIICGATWNSIDDCKLIDEIINQDEFNIILKQELNNHLSYKKAWISALKKYNVKEEILQGFAESNNQLAWEYYQTIKKKQYHIELEFIKRKYDKDLPSGRMLNKLVLENNNINYYLPFNEEIIDLKTSINKLTDLIKYNLLFNNNLHLDDKEGIYNYLKNNLNLELDGSVFFENYANKSNCY